MFRLQFPQARVRIVLHRKLSLTRHRTDYNGFYTAWNSMATLIQRGLVEKIGGARSAQSEMGTTYRLSEAGLELAKELQTEAQEIEEGKRPAPAPPKRATAASETSV